ncbi:MAG: hypothetical protein LYZ66_01660 [Nitrososphaerales archaeon]|nr:hypothetical protein [Nitrososphaerales archaeon]
MGRVDKGIKCGISDCPNNAVRSLSREQLSGSGLDAGGEGRRVYLCHDHYRTWKKATKKSKSLERARW